MAGATEARGSSRSTRRDATPLISSYHAEIFPGVEATHDVYVKCSCEVGHTHLSYVLSPAALSEFLASPRYQTEPLRWGI